MSNKINEVLNLIKRLGIEAVMWVCCLWFLLLGLVELSQGGRGIIGGIIALIIAVFCNPFFNKFINSKGIYLKKLISIPVVFIAFFVTLALMPTESKTVADADISIESDEPSIEYDDSNNEHQVLGMGTEVEENEIVDRSIESNEELEAQIEKENEEKRLAEEQAAEEKRIADEKAAEEKKIAEEKRIAEEQTKAAEEKRIAEEKAKAAEEKRIAEEQAKAVEEKRIAEEQAKAAEENSTAVTTSSDNATHDSVVVPGGNIEGEDLVWVPVNGGDKYHRKASCSNMIDPVQIPRSDAKARNYQPCGRCKPGN